jgi:hypothetical protein
MGNIEVIGVRDLAEECSAAPETQSRIVRELSKLFCAQSRHGYQN